MINSIATGSGFATAKTETAALLSGGGFSPLGGGTVNFGGSLTKAEQVDAANQLSLLERQAVATKAAGLAARDFTQEGGAVARAASSMGIAAGDAGGRLAALGGTLASTGALGLGVGAAIVAMGGLYLGTKSIIEIAEANDGANRSLAQAYQYLGQAVPTQQIDQFIEKNRAFLPSIAEAKNSFASLARAGMDFKEQQRVMNDAIDLAAAKHIDLTTAVNTLLMAESGRATGLLQLGINVREIIDPHKDLAAATREASTADREKVAADRSVQEELTRLHDKTSVSQNDLMHLQDLKARDVAATQKQTDAHQALATARQLVNDKGDKFNSILDQLEPKIARARDTTTPLEQSTAKLSNDWQELANTAGPMLIPILDQVAQALDRGFKGIQAAQGPSNDSFWQGVQRSATSTGLSLQVWYIQTFLTDPAGLAWAKANWPAAYRELFGGSDAPPAKPSPLVPSAGPGSVEAAKRAQQILAASGQDIGPSTPTAGSSIVPPIVQAQLDAQRAAHEDAARLEAINNRIVGHLMSIDRNTASPPRLYVTIQDMSRGAASITARVLRQASQV